MRGLFSFVVDLLLLLLLLVAVMATRGHASMTFVAFYPPVLPTYMAAHGDWMLVELRVHQETLRIKDVGGGDSSDVNSTAPEEGAALLMDDDEGMVLVMIADFTAASHVRVTPRSEGITFEPASIVFRGGEGVVQSVGMLASQHGPAMIEYEVTIEDDAVADPTTLVPDLITEDNTTTAVMTQQIDVLAPPIAYDVLDTQWEGVVLVNDSFDDDVRSGALSSAWGQVRHGYPSNACGAADGELALYFTALGDRFATTKTRNLNGFQGRMHFHHAYGFRAGQSYDALGDNRISCDAVEAGEEVLFTYLPVGADATNTSHWQLIHELALPLAVMVNRSSDNGSDQGEFRSYMLALPSEAMHASAQFRWMQKQHSSFPLDIVKGLSSQELRHGENDPTSTRGELGVTERELWRYRNLLDQWALDNVQLEVRLAPPTFQILENSGVAIAVGMANISVGYADVVVASPVPHSWVEYTVGDGAQAFPICDSSRVVPEDDSADTSRRATIRMTESGYVHGVVCLRTATTTLSSSLVTSFGSRSPRIFVQAHAPVLTHALDRTNSVDTWRITLACDGCTFMRYTILSANETEMTSLTSFKQARLVPSCSYGYRLNWTDTTPSTEHQRQHQHQITVAANTRLFAIACARDLLASSVASTDVLIVAPREPSFTYTATETTIMDAFEVVITPPDAVLGIAYVVVSIDDNQSEIDPQPSCSKFFASMTPEAGTHTVVVRASSVIRAVTCCIDVICADSVVSTWGPIAVRAVAPVYEMQCSRLRPLTMLVHLTALTEKALVRYRVLPSVDVATPAMKQDKLITLIDCASSQLIGELYRGDAPIQVGLYPSRVLAVSCRDGLVASDVVEIVVDVSPCCAGRDAFQYPSCAHMLLLHDDFTTVSPSPSSPWSPTCLNSSKWRPVTSQWGGHNVNGGVHAANVDCSQRDDSDGATKTVMQLTAHGDLFTGTTPVGHQWVDQGIDNVLLAERTMNDHYLLEWALAGASPVPCNPMGAGGMERCLTHRVGAAVTTTPLPPQAGVFFVRIKPCAAFGTLTQIWWGEYGQAQAKQQAQDGTPAAEATLPFLPLWRAGMYQAKTSAEQPFVFVAPSPPSASPSQGSASDSTTDAYMELGMQWNASEGRANLYVDGQLVHKQVNLGSFALQEQTLSMGVWFPNAVAGQPLFESCEVLVDEVHVFDAAITGDRWCEFETGVADGSVACTVDADCEDWVATHCFMPIHEAICENQPQERDEPASSIATGNCHFRLQPSMSAPSFTAHETTRRQFLTQWPRDEY